MEHILIIEITQAQLQEELSKQSDNYIEKTDTQEQINLAIYNILKNKTAVIKYK